MDSRQDGRRVRGDVGFTMIELLVGMVIMGALAAMSTSGWTRYQRTVEHRGSAQELVSTLRNAQQRALAEATSYCVTFDVTRRSYELFRSACGAAGNGETDRTQSPRIELVSPDFQQTDGSTAPRVTFTARGSASKGTVLVTRENSSKQYVITVEGLTGRVSLAG